MLIVEKKLIQLWKDLLKLDNIDSKQDFYQLGGNSFLAIQLLYNIKNEIGVELPISSFIRRPMTIDYLMKILNNNSSQFSLKNIINDSFCNDVKNIKHDPLIWPSYEYKKIQTIFLTGGSGFIGAHILNSLLRNSNYRIYCLVHSPNEKLGWKKLQDTMLFFRLSQLNHQRIRVVAGDLSKKKFGLSPQAFNSLAEKVDIIIHAGAVVNFEMSYSDLKPVNINGTREILRLSATVKSKPVHYISSLAVLGIDHSKKTTIIYSENDLSKLKPVSTYAQTKLIAERNIRFGIKNGLKANVYRLGEIAPASLTGVPNPKALHHLFIKGCNIIGIYPKSSVKIDYLPVDFVADFIVKIIVSENKLLLGKVFQLCHPYGLSFDQIFKLSIRQGFKIKSMNGRLFINQLKQQSACAPEAAALKLFLEKEKLKKFNVDNIFESFFLKEMKYVSMENTKDAIKKLKLTFPILNDKALSSYLLYLNNGNKLYELS